MPTTITVMENGVQLEPHYFGPKADPDRFGKRGGYRVHPKSDNLSENAVYYRSIDDVAEHLKANPDWGLRFTVNGKPNSRYNHILINGVPR